MTVVASLKGAEDLSVEPGRETTCELTLSNTGTIVEQFTIMVLGDGAAWIRPDPPVVSMFPGAQQTVKLHFSPPRDHSTLAGQMPFAVKVIPSNEPEESVTEEGVISVGSFNDVGAELLPRRPVGRIYGRQKLAVDSRGNLPLAVAVSALDASDALRFRFRPEKLTAAPGAAHFTRIRIKPRKRFFRGHPQIKPYQVTVGAEGERPLVLDGQFEQRAVLPKWLLALLAILAAALLIWFFLLRPYVHDTAVNANKTALAAAQKAQQQANAAQQGANAAGSTANQALAKANGKPAPTTTTTTVKSTTTTTKPKTTTTTTVQSVAVAVVPTTTAAPVTSPTDGNLETIAPPGSTAFGKTQPVADGTTITITNLVIQNISGSAGTARIQRVDGKTTQDLLVENLSTLTDQEYTFNTPIYFTHGEVLQLRVDCAGNQTACEVGVYYTGPITQPVQDTTTTLP
jgi:hypothetical protein